MSAVFAFSKSEDGPVFLDQFQMTGIVSLELGNGRYLVFGKVVIRNADSDPQNAQVQLRRSDGSGPSFATLDQSAVQISEAGEGDQVAVSVQVGFRIAEAEVETVDLACASANGFAAEAQLAALKLDFLNNQ